MRLEDITPVVLTYNEAPNIGRCLEQLRWAQRVIVVDSGSTDETAAIARKFSNVEALERRFDNHTAQWNHGVEHASTPWVLALDADYILPPEFVEELRALTPGVNAAFYASFAYIVGGKRLRGTLYPQRAVLFDRGRCLYVADGHTQLLQIDGPVGRLVNKIDHDDRKPLGHWLQSQKNYAALEVDKLLTKGASGMADRLRLMIWPAAPAAFVYALFVKGLILDGWPGFYYSLQRTYAELLLSLMLLERKFAAKTSAEAEEYRR